MVSYQLSVITPKGEAFTGDVESVIAPGEYGSFGVMAHHAPMVISLKPGPLTVTQQGKPHYYAVGSGILEVNGRNRVLVLTDSARPSATYEDAKQPIKNDE